MASTFCMLGRHFMDSLLEALECPESLAVRREYKEEWEDFLEKFVECSITAASLDCFC